MSESEEYEQARRRKLLAEGRVYEARHMEHIPLRACYWSRESEGYSGVALPDGRLIFAARSGIVTYSSEQVLLHMQPGASFNWAPHADAAVNRVMELSDAPDH